MKTKVDFLTQAKLDDEEFVKALAHGRTVRKEMNLAYSRIKRRTTASILTKDRPIKGDRTNIHTQQGTARYTPKPRARNETNPKKNDKTDLFVVTKVRMKAKRPSDTVISPMRSRVQESVNLPRLNMPTPVGSTRIYVDL